MSATFVVALLALTGSIFATPIEIQMRTGLHCGDIGPYAPINDIRTCIDYLKRNGNEDCVVGPGKGGFCMSGKGLIVGSGFGRTKCQNIAAAAEAILGNCTTVEQYVGGTSSVGGNDNVMVTVRHP
ncbi:hypothetical protein BJY01DRAFT_247297 [Aspergillus pseudoustus]|uniref:Uncharacterized protein n=1 Tax=Aspergillus pseudoustus TaxID=1810923 RepID=A0ABR4K240_9EURO